MNDHPIRDPEGYFAALSDEQNALDDALAAIRAEQAEGRLSAAGAAREREQLLTAHLRRVAAIRARYLGEPG
jgi:hypothetical protein